MPEVELPHSTTATLNAWCPTSAAHSRPRMAVVGAAGEIGRVTGQCFTDEDLVLIGLDVLDHHNIVGYHAWSTGTVADKAVVRHGLGDADYVLYLPTGAKMGWHGLLEAEIHGVKNVAEVCVEKGVKRLIYASSNHVTGMNEVDLYETGVLDTPHPTSLPRPDGLYGAAKAFAEALLRSTSEIHGLPVSIIRIGAMRYRDDPHAVTDGPRFARQTNKEYRQRMERVWLTHQEWKATITRELAATDQFRLFYAPQHQADQPWTGEIYTWNRGR